MTGIRPVRVRYQVQTTLMAKGIEIVKDDLKDGRIEALLKLHLEEMHKYSPSESIHALDSEALKDRSMTFWSARIKDTLVGCGALKAIDAQSGEVKSMKTDKDHLRKGIAKQLLLTIIAEAKQRNYTRLYLETGTNPAFKPAISLYKKHGFIECEPFADYASDPYSCFFTKVL